mgnify:CR=1 FL=1|jgi:hypothetical protein|tara:strand:+ start:212 stop:754 length:543 start_codon:yes stop_codon:yes gene_type:complete
MDDLDKYVYIENILSKDERELLFNYVKLFNINNKDNFCSQCKLHETFRYGDPITDSLLQSKKQIFEKEANLNLIETYSFWRLYKKFSSLEKHTDRESCEVTISVNVAADLEWPLFIGNERIIIKPGDGVLYFGAKVEHWREEYEGDYSLQIFLHYVLKDGKFTEYKWDKREYIGAPKNAF